MKYFFIVMVLIILGAIISVFIPNELKYSFGYVIGLLVEVFIEKGINEWGK